MYKKNFRLKSKQSRAHIRQNEWLWKLKGLQFKIARLVLEVNKHQIEMLSGIKAEVLRKFEEGKPIMRNGLVQQSYQTALNLVCYHKFNLRPKHDYKYFSTYEPINLMELCLYHHVISPFQLRRAIVACGCEVRLTEDEWQIFTESDSFSIRIY